MLGNYLLLTCVEQWVVHSFCFETPGLFLNSITVRLHHLHSGNSFALLFHCKIVIFFVEDFILINIYQSYPIICPICYFSVTSAHRSIYPPTHVSIVPPTIISSICPSTDFIHSSIDSSSTDLNICRPIHFNDQNLPLSPFPLSICS